MSTLVVILICWHLKIMLLCFVDNVISSLSYCYGCLKENNRLFSRFKSFRFDTRSAVIRRLTVCCSWSGNENKIIPSTGWLSKFCLRRRRPIIPFPTGLIKWLNSNFCSTTFWKSFTDLELKGLVFLRCSNLKLKTVKEFV